MLKHIKKLLERSTYVISVLLTVIIIYLSLSSLSELNIEISASDKLLHTLAYFALSFSWFFSVIRYNKNSKSKFFVALSVFALGCALEFLQGYLTANRMMDFYDVAANSLGIVIAFILYNHVTKLFKTI